ncbi:hypothetical protein ACF1B0_07700 [Streptomyces anandii]|uniref:hypothetical protein n=1 Tax=Streptomyces anandii TaxID=285454 RepID=UPI0036F5AC6E
MTERKSSSVLAAPLHGAAHVLRRVPGAGVVGRAAQGTLDKVGAVSPRGRRLAVYTGAGVLGVAGVVEWPVALTGAAVAWLTQPRPAGTTDGASAGTATAGADAARDGADQGRSRSAATGPVTADGEPAEAVASRTAAGKRASTAATRTTARKTTAKAATKTASRTTAKTVSRTTAKTASKTVGKTASKSAAKTAGGTAGRPAGKASGTRDLASAALKSTGTASETPPEGASGRSGRGKSSGTQASAGPLGPTARPDRTTL